MWPCRSTGPEIACGLGRGYLDAVTRIANRDMRGAAPSDSTSVTPQSSVLSRNRSTRLDALSLSPGLVDIYIDYEAFGLLPERFSDDGNLRESVEAAVEVTSQRGFRTIVLCGSSIPASVGKKYDHAALRIPRREMALWQHALRTCTNCLVHYGDYGVMYAHQAEGGAARPPSRIRLSTAGEYVLYRAPTDSYRQPLRDGDG